VTRKSTFWDRRRAAVVAEVEAAETAQTLAQDAEQQQVLAEMPDEDVLKALNLPDPETLKKGDDFTAFMAKAVPDHIRKRALRKLWRSNPVLACVDGLNDYDDDYLTGSFGNAPLKTTYQVGQGLQAYVADQMRHIEATPEGQPPLDKPADMVESVETIGEDLQPESLPDTANDVPEKIELPEHTKPSRMVFHFDEKNA